MKKFITWLKSKVLKVLVASWAGIVAVWTKLKTKVNIGLLLVIVVLATLIVVGGIKCNKRQPAVTTPTFKTTVQKVVENPTKKQAKKATAAITEQSTVKISGTAKKIGSTVKIPVSGTVSTTYIDSKTKEQVGQGTHKVSGETTVTVQDGAVTAETTLNDTNQVAIVTEPAKKRNELSYEYDGDQKLNYQRNVISFDIWKLQADGYIGAEVNIDDADVKANAGVRVRW